MPELRFGILGAGFWSLFQIAAWYEVGGARPIAIYNRTIEKAENAARRFGISKTYNNPEEMLSKECNNLDFVDIITAVETHTPFVQLVAKYKIPIICQKPMSTDLCSAEKMVASCRELGVSFYIHENWRWQTPIRALKKVLDTCIIGTPFRARIDMISGFPVFSNQPSLCELEHFILLDLGSHILDVARFLFGEATSLYCQVKQVHKNIKGEDVATVIMKMGTGITVTCNLAYAENFLEREAFPQTFIFIEGSRGSLELSPDYWLRVTTCDGTHLNHVVPRLYSWVDPAYEVVQSSIVPCNANLLSALKGEGSAETAGEDNLKTMRLVFASYDSATENKNINF